MRIGQSWTLFTPILLLILVPTGASGQTGPAGTEIFLATIHSDAKGLQVGEPANITNRPGYDNQPCFTPDGRRILYTSYRDDGQSDIYVYDIDSGKTSALVRTPESEYSPVVTPDGGHVSVVRVEADSTQRLWQFSLGGEGAEVLLAQRPGVGYYAWGNDSTVVLFVLGDPHELHVGNVHSGDSRSVTDHIGRCLQRLPDRNAISFLQLHSENKWWIHTIDLETLEIDPALSALPESQDFVWLPDGSPLMAFGSGLFQWQASPSPGWRRIADLAEHPLKNITRLAVSPDGKLLALVTDE
jgi:dipeptidyl aminopeptidase/acylaminoacyl peptidase